jgi:putative tryptophan/tyrosine transport system substrate-binding protein
MRFPLFNPGLRRLRNCTAERKLRILLREVFFTAVFILPGLFFASLSLAADVLIIGDLRYKPVSEVATGVKRSLQSASRIYALSEVRGGLAAVASREDARVVVALGKDALDEALKLPSSIAVIYGLIISPPANSRQNMTGVFMSTPVSEYVEVIRKYLPSIRKIAVIGSQDLLMSLNAAGHANVSVYRAGNSVELVRTLNRIGDSHALLLLPDVSMLSSSVMETVYLFSYRRNIPLLGISEGNVRQGSLIALVFDPNAVSEQIASMTERIMQGNDISGIRPEAPRKYRLSLNINTARKMGINIPESLIRNTHKIYE